MHCEPPEGSTCGSTPESVDNGITSLNRFVRASSVELSNFIQQSHLANLWLHSANLHVDDWCITLAARILKNCSFCGFRCELRVRLWCAHSFQHRSLWARDYWTNLPVRLVGCRRRLPAYPWLYSTIHLLANSHVVHLLFFIFSALHHYSTIYVPSCCCFQDGLHIHLCLLSTCFLISST